MQAGELVIQRQRTGLTARAIPAYSRLCVVATGIGLTAFGILPGTLPARIWLSTLVGAAVLGFQYLCASNILPTSVLNAFDAILTQESSPQPPSSDE